MLHRSIITAFLAAQATAGVSQATQPAAPLQPLSRAAVMQQIDAEFVAFDANKDGFLDRTEMEAAESRALAERKAQALKAREAAFHRLDADKNGTLTLQEFNAVMAATPLAKANATPILARYDTNKDGKISLVENRALAVVWFDRADTNKDGIVSTDERRVAASRR